MTNVFPSLYFATLPRNPETKSCKGFHTIFVPADALPIHLPCTFQTPGKAGIGLCMESRCSCKRFNTLYKYRPYASFLLCATVHGTLLFSVDISTR